MVFQNFNLFPHYNVEDNIAKPCQIVRKMSVQQSRQWAAKLLKKVHLLDKSKEYPANLSGGQQQRVAIARALAMEPDILLFDEPTSSLDPELAHEVFDTIAHLAAEGLTMVIVSHQINVLKAFATRIVFLHEGRIEVDGSTEEVFAKCENPNLLNFIKKVNFLDI